ncbi:hypothetical protein JHK87_016549 [Glycine soja]|nr:hypothetical protein JHK87_016549 [Glycine soja]KAG5047227.1 hypothetical protein JHK86_016633 [Glycine max]
MVEIIYDANLKDEGNIVADQLLVSDPSRKTAILEAKSKEFQGLSPSHFITVLRHTVRSIINFVRLIVDDMRYAGWDIDATVDAIEQNVVYMAEDHKCFTKMAKRVWLLHCLAFSYEPQASIFQVGKWCIFSDVYMEV